MKRQLETTLDASSASFRFEHEEFYKEITSYRDYERLRFEDIPKSERKPIKQIKQLATTCPYTAEALEKFRTMQQPSDEWLAARSEFFTASRFAYMSNDQPNSYGMALDYWREVTGRILPKPIEARQQGYMDHGRLWEPVARGCYERKFGVTVYEEGLRILNEAPWIYSASPDGLINNNPQAEGIIEIKCNAVKPPRDFVPVQYLSQMMGQMAVYKAPFCDFINYWVRAETTKRFFFSTRIAFNAEYWSKLKMRLDYFAWCVCNDVAPTGMGELLLLHPLPKITGQPIAYDVTDAADDNIFLKEPLPAPKKEETTTTS
jgi:hypothetical protein